MLMLIVETLLYAGDLLVSTVLRIWLHSVQKSDLM